MSKQHRGRITGEPVTHRLPTPAGGVRLETFVPWTLVKRGAKKAVITPPGCAAGVRGGGAVRSARPERPRSTRRCCGPSGSPITGRRLLDEQRVASVAEIAEAEGVDVTQPSSLTAVISGGYLLRYVQQPSDLHEVSSEMSKVQCHNRLCLHCYSRQDWLRFRHVYPPYHDQEPADGEPCYTYRLSSRSGRQTGTPAHVLNLGRHFEVPREQWGALVQRIEHLVGGQQDLMPAFWIRNGKRRRNAMRRS